MSTNIKQFGYHPEDFTKNRLKYSDFIHPEYREKVIEDINDHISKTGNSFEQVFFINQKNGLPRKVYCNINIRRNKYQVATHCDGYILDITDLEKKTDVFK